MTGEIEVTPKLIPPMALSVVLMVTMMGCMQVEDEQAREAAARDAALHAKWDAFSKRQEIQDCVPRPYDESAIELVLRIFQGDYYLFPSAERDPYNRSADRIVNLKTRPNPKGEGVIVTSWKDTNGIGVCSACFSRERAAWLILDGKVYAINQHAANWLGFLYGGMPERIQRRAGLLHSYERGNTMMDQIGLEEYTSERRFSGINPFPQC